MTPPSVRSIVMARGGAGRVYLSKRQPEMIAETGCTGTIECAASAFAEHLFLLAWLLVMVLVAVGSLVVLPKARELCEQERRRTRAEYDAFDRFLVQIREMSPAPTVSRTAGVDQPVVLQQSVGVTGDLSELRSAYEETVLAVPHYEEEYDETPVEHMREELSDEVAQAVIAGSTLSEPLYRSVLDAATAARDRRKRFLEMIDREAASLATHTEELRRIDADVQELTSPLCADQSFDALRGQRRQLTDFEGEIEGIVNERQADRTTNRKQVVRTDHDLDLQSYLYRSLDATYPVLAEAMDLLAQVSVTLRRVEDELIYRG